MTPAKRRTLDRFLHTDDSLRSLARLGLRGARELTGRPQTLGAEWMLFHAFAWRRLLAATTRERPVRRWRIDALPPPEPPPPPPLPLPAGYTTPVEVPSAKLIERIRQPRAM